MNNEASRCHCDKNGLQHNPLVSMPGDTPNNHDNNNDTITPGLSSSSTTTTVTSKAADNANAATSTTTTTKPNKGKEKEEEEGSSHDYYDLERKQQLFTMNDGSSSSIRTASVDRWNRGESNMWRSIDDFNIHHHNNDRPASLDDNFIHFLSSSSPSASTSATSSPFIHTQHHIPSFSPPSPSTSTTTNDFISPHHDSALRQFATRTSSIDRRRRLHRRSRNSDDFTRLLGERFMLDNYQHTSPLRIPSPVHRSIYQNVSKSTRKEPTESHEPSQTRGLLHEEFYVLDDNADNMLDRLILRSMELLRISRDIVQSNEEMLLYHKRLLVAEDEIATEQKSLRLKRKLDVANETSLLLSAVTQDISNLSQLAYTSMTKDYLSKRLLRSEDFRAPLNRASTVYVNALPVLTSISGSVIDNSSRDDRSATPSSPRTPQGYVEGSEYDESFDEVYQHRPTSPPLFNPTSLLPNVIQSFFTPSSSSATLMQGGSPSPDTKGVTIPHRHRHSHLQQEQNSHQNDISATQKSEPSSTPILRAEDSLRTALNNSFESNKTTTAESTPRRVSASAALNSNSDSVSDSRLLLDENVTGSPKRNHRKPHHRRSAQSTSAITFLSPGKSAAVTETNSLPFQSSPSHSPAASLGTETNPYSSMQSPSPSSTSRLPQKIVTKLPNSWSKSVTSPDSTTTDSYPRPSPTTSPSAKELLSSSLEEK